MLYSSSLLSQFFFDSKFIQTDSPSQSFLISKIEHLIQAFKSNITTNLKAIRTSLTGKILTDDKKAQDTQDDIIFYLQALEVCERISMIRDPVYDLAYIKKHFSPSVVKSIKTPGSVGFNYGANAYSERHNMIISCPSNNLMYFYNAKDMTQITCRGIKQLSSSVIQTSYNSEADTYLMGCTSGDIYTYNANTNKLTKILKQGNSFILAITYITADTFAFSSSRSGKLYFGSINSGSAVTHACTNIDSWYLHNLAEKKLLVSGLANGRIALYNTNKVGFPIIGSYQAHGYGKYVTAITSARINGKDYIVTGGNDQKIKIWQFTRGRIRLVKAIQNSESISNIIYLEEYQTIATTHHDKYIKFFALPSGEMRAKLDVGLTKAGNMFWMKDKNQLGIAGMMDSHIQILQLHTTQDSSKAESAVECVAASI